MATSNPTSTSDQSSASTQQRRMNDAYSSFKHNAALAMLVVAPALIAIPPRKLDFYTFSLAGAFVVSANQVTVERTGRGILSHFSYGRARGMPIAAESTEVQRDGQRRRLLEEKSGMPEDVWRRDVHNTNVSRVKGPIEEKAKDIWISAEAKDWKAERLKEEQEKLDRGEGYGDMIMDQVWEVWNWGEKKGEELKKKDELVVKQQQQEKSEKTR